MMRWRPEKSGHPALYLLSQNALTSAAILVLCAFISLAIFGAYIVPRDPLITNVSNALNSPSAQHWLGTATCWMGHLQPCHRRNPARFGNRIQCCRPSWTTGSAIGAVIGFTGGFVDAAVNRFVDVLMAFPLFVLAMVFVVLFGIDSRRCAVRGRLRRSSMLR